MQARVRTAPELVIGGQQNIEKAREILFAELCRLLRQARALVVTSQIAETTSLVALEAMASGTPVIAFRRGALAEVVREGTGFLVESVEEMAAACARAGEIRSENCRSWVEQEYSAEQMADAYEALVQRILAW